MIHNLVIVGSGPAGYTAALYAARGGLEPVVIAGLVSAGGALMKTTEVDNFPGFPTGVLGPELMEAMREQAARFGADIRYEDAEHLELHGDVKTVTTGSGEVLRTRAVIIATGATYRELGLPSEGQFAGKGVSWCATCDGFFFKDKEVAVVGGGDSALTEALFLARLAAKVTIVHRRDQLRASQVLIEHAQAEPKIEFAYNREVAEILGDNLVTGVTLRDTASGALHTLPVSAVFVAIGHDPHSALVRGQLEVDDDGYIVVEGRSQRTSVPGVFACGDVVDRFYRQAITAAGSGCAAALDVQDYFDNL